MSRIVIFSSGFVDSFRVGGPARSISNLVSQLASDHNITVICPSTDHGNSYSDLELIHQPIQQNGAEVYYLDMRRLKSWVTIVKEIRKEKVDVIVLNSFWSLWLSLLPTLLIKIGLISTQISILMPRGELGQGALDIKRWKKDKFLPVFKSIYLDTIDYFGVTSIDEEIDVKQSIPLANTIVTSNIPDYVPFSAIRKRDHELQEYDLKLLYLSRINRKKGLLFAIHALSKVKKRIMFDIYGAVDDASYFEECLAAIKQVPENVTVNLKGPVDRNRVSQIFAEYDALVLLTANENFGHVIAESLQGGTLVICSVNTPWTEELKSGGGVVIDTLADSTYIAKVIDELASLSDQEWNENRLQSFNAYRRFISRQPPNVVDIALGK